MVMSVWLDTYPDDFFEPPSYPTLSSLLEFAVTNAVDGDLVQRSRDQLRTFQVREDTELPGSGLGEPLKGILQDFGWVWVFKDSRTVCSKRPSRELKE